MIQPNLRLPHNQAKPRNDEAIGQHKTTAHYKGWADFKAAGGVEHQAVMRLENEAWLLDVFC